MPLTPQRLKDHCLIIVGEGGEADRILAKRRLAAGGRLAHFQTQGPEDDRVCQQALIADVSEYFTWQPPPQKMPISSFAKKQMGKARSFWTKIGPDGVEVQPGQKLKLMAGVDGKPKHLELWDGERLLVQMSGEIVLDVSQAEARTYDVEVYNPELKAFGTVSWRFVLIAIPMQFFYQMAKFLLSIDLENRAAEGQVPWFRGLMTVFEACVGLSVCVEMWSWSLNGVPATGAQYLLSGFQGTVVVMIAAYFQLSEFMSCVCTLPGTLGVTLLYHYLTREENRTRRLLPHIKWTIAQGFGTAVSRTHFDYIFAT